MPNLYEDMVAKIFSTLFKKEINSNDDISMESEPKWDSMKHIEIIMVLEEELGISFRPESIPALTSMSKIIDEIKKIKG
ncbi:acyl carrier protein [Gilliamella sp. W8126]|uniref:Acyl carrier protein n=1 Tax=Gilliamella apis TaxID=1970738 RepID=A0A2V4DTR3_9GAMM|nr:MULTISPECIES: acyl carrier protein [Gilliamella]MBI0005853.1 acyl carrier protein [Gilliamella sp. W8126]PXY91521.1 acyl carrier protein [Gilliamella apis]WLS93486.1 acyl carrier protein [Gilliamella apis]